MKTILTHPNFSYLWENLSEKNNLFYDKIKFNKFPDSWPSFFIEKVEENIYSKEIIYIWDFSKPENLFENYSIIRWILEYWAKKLDIFMPFFPVAQMERINNIWEIAIAKYYADIFSLLPTWSSSKTTIHIFDIHALPVRFYFDNFKVNIELLSAMNLIKKIIAKETIIAFPDEWAFKRFSKDFEEYEKIICFKIRKNDKKEIVIKEWNPKNKDLLIVDDLIQSGWTIIETVKLLKRLWANKVSAFATHWVFPNNAHIEVAKNLDNLYVSDSIPENINREKDAENMIVLNLCELIKSKIC